MPDPRETITPEPFTVAPGLLGLPLARPWRRATAMLIDLATCGLLVALLPTAGIILGAIGAILLFRATPGNPDAPAARRAGLGVLRATGALFVFIACIVLWNSIDIGGRDDGGAGASGPDPTVTAASLGALGLDPFDMATIFSANSEAEARRAAERITKRLADEGLTPDDAAELRKALDAFDPEPMSWSPLGFEALRRALREVETGGVTGADTIRVDTDSLALAYAAALRSGDSTAAATLRPRLAGRLAADTLGVLERRAHRLEQRTERLEQANDELKERLDDGGGLVGRALGLMHDLGLSFGWLALYFTAFLTRWQGLTPGKRLLGIRVIRLDGKPIGWWFAFERFGGYGAAVSTGLLGFLQILWDRNRQGIHDKIAGTVVVREG
ncbi:MAG TPA: RDD family protein [Longimicrobiales bacterium]